MMRVLFLLAAIAGSCQSSSQPTAGESHVLHGHFPAYANEKFVLQGFRGFDTYPIATATADDEGRFSISYKHAAVGMGALSVEKGKPFFVVLSGEAIALEGGVLEAPETIECTAGSEQQAFAQYASEQPRREQALSAWGYLERMYAADSLFFAAKDAKKAIKKENERIKKESHDFIESLPAGSYARWYLPMRKLVSTVSTIAQYRTEEIPETIAAFRQIDHSDPRLHSSGLYRDAIESHYWLLENSGKPLDSVFIEMNISTDHLLASLENDEEKFNEITNYLFDLLERHSLFDAAEYLALKALTQGSCTLNEDLSKQLETYRAMKKGNTAPDIAFSAESLIKGTEVSSPSKLSELKAGHKLIVFGASWCPKCTEEIPQIAGLYNKWKQYDVEVVFISLDDSPADFRNFSKDFPFLSYCDFKKWDSPVTENYYVFATPTMFLLDRDHVIILRPNSVRQVDAWVDWYLAEER